MASKRKRKEQYKDLSKYVNKQRTLVFSSRGISNRGRHFMADLRDLLAHSKKDVKLDTKNKLHIVNEIAELKNCNNTIFFEARKKGDLYMWMARCPNGPSAKFLVQNVHTMEEVKLTGNCLKGSRPLLSFDPKFDSTPAYRLLKEMMVQIMGTPKAHPKSKPFIDHVFSFNIEDDRIFFRNYQVVYDAPDPNSTVVQAVDALAKPAASQDPVLIEIGPRFVLNPIKIFAGSFCGETLWENPFYVTPSKSRRTVKMAKAHRYDNRKDAQEDRSKRQKQAKLPKDVLEDVFK